MEWGWGRCRSGFCSVGIRRRRATRPPPPPRSAPGRPRLGVRCSRPTHHLAEGLVGGRTCGAPQRWPEEEGPGPMKEGRVVELTQREVPVRSGARPCEDERIFCDPRRMLRISLSFGDRSGAGVKHGQVMGESSRDVAETSRTRREVGAFRRACIDAPSSWSRPAALRPDASMSATGSPLARARSGRRGPYGSSPPRGLPGHTAPWALPPPVRIRRRGGPRVIVGLGEAGVGPDLIRSHTAARLSHGGCGDDRAEKLSSSLRGKR